MSAGVFPVTTSATLIAADASSPASPYAPFRVADWMRAPLPVGYQSSIADTASGAPVSSPDGSASASFLPDQASRLSHNPPGRPSLRQPVSWSCWVQGDLFSLTPEPGFASNDPLCV